MGIRSKIFGIAGICLVAVALALWVIKFEFDLTVAIITMTGLFFLLFTLVANFSGFRGLLGRRSTRYGMGSIITIVLVLAIMVFVEAISSKNSLRVDMTENKRHSLSSQTIKILKGLNVEVEALAFYGKNRRDRDRWEDQLKLYQHRSKRFKYKMIDPEMDPTVTKEHGVKLYGTTVVKSGGRQVKIEEGSEENLTNAILKVLRSEKKLVYFLKGHGEASIDDESENGYSLTRESIEDESYEVREVVLLRREKVPQDAALVIVNGPKVLLSDHEFKLLSEYLEDGGGILFMIDPDAAPGIGEFLGKYGVVLSRDVVVDPMSRMFGADFRMPVVTEYANHPITENFGIASFFPVARSINVDQGKLSKEDKIIVLASTGPKSWSETDLEKLTSGQAVYDEDKDKMGPVPVAVVVTLGENRPKDPSGIKRMPVGKLVVYGDSDFASNSYLGAAGNRDLLLNTVRWLAGEEDLIAIRPRRFNDTPLFLKASQARMIFILPVVVVPMGILVTGLVVYIRRRKIR